MNFLYNDNVNKLDKYSIKINEKWNEKEVNDNLLNSIFNKIDNGDKKVSEEEYTTLSQIVEILPKQGNTINENDDKLLLEKLNGDKNLFTAIKLMHGDFEALDENNNIVEVIKNYSEITGGKSLRTEILQQLFSGEINRDEAVDRLCKIEELVEDFECDYQNSGSTYWKYFQENILQDYNSFSTWYLDEYLDKTEIIQMRCQNDPELINKINTFKNDFKEKFGFEISDFGLYKAQSYGYLKLSDLDIDKFPIDSSTVEDAIYNIKSFNITEESLIEAARFSDKKLERYIFDIHKSEIAPILQKSEAMREKDNNKYSIEFTGEGSYEITNIETGEKRVVDLNKLTSGLNDEQKNIIFRAFRGMNNLMKWEFSQEVNSEIVVATSLSASGQYFIDTDKIGMSDKTDSYTLSHEIIHAMMATMIDGKNTFNEEQNKTFLETFEKERANFLKEENLENVSRDSYSRYQYAAVNIHEFAAESGCLHLLGTSTSQYTIAKYFPESYKIMVEMIEEIRAQKENRVLPNETNPTE